MDNRELLVNRLSICIASAKKTVIASFDENIKETRQQAVDTFWAIKELGDYLQQLQQKSIGAEYELHKRVGSD